MYKTEAAFSRAFVMAAKKHYNMVQRLETGTTGCGVPDLLLIDKYGEAWVELKNDNHLSIYDTSWVIKWRPGQQAWSYKYFEASDHLKYTITIVSCRDGFICIPMNKIYNSNKVYHNDAGVVVNTSLKDLIR